MSDIVYRTTNPSAWGTGQGSDLSAPQIDNNFWQLASAIQALQDHADGNAGIAYFSVSGDQFFITLTDHLVLGPYTLPVAQWTFTNPPTGAWLPDTEYQPMDIFTVDGSLYLVIWPHTSAATFDANANDGMGHNFYALILAQPQDELPDDGTPGQVLTKVTGSPYQVAWTSPTRILAFYAEGAVDDNELVFQFIAVEDMTLPLGLEGSQATSFTAPTSDQEFSFYKNGTLIGNVTFTASPDEPGFTFPAEISIVPGDIIDVIAPASADPHQTNISITLLALLA